MRRHCDRNVADFSSITCRRERRSSDTWMLSGRRIAASSHDGQGRDSGFAIASAGTENDAAVCTDDDAGAWADDDAAPSATNTIVANTLRASVILRGRCFIQPRVSKNRSGVLAHRASRAAERRPPRGLAANHRRKSEIAIDVADRRRGIRRPQTFSTITGGATRSSMTAHAIVGSPPRA